MTEFRNWLRHKLGCNQGQIMSWTSPEGRILIGFMCECGTIHGVNDITHLADRAAVEG